MQENLQKTRKNKAPIFICGEGRSGTKLLRDCLAKHPNLHNFRCESYFFVDSIFRKLRFIDDSKDPEILTKSVIAALISKNKSSAEKTIKSQNFSSEYQEYWNELKTFIDQEKAIDKFEVFDICTNYLCKKNGKRRWIEKTPFHIYYIDKIQDFYPDAKFIINYRDPRAVVASWLKKDSNKTLLGVTYSWNKVAKKITSLMKDNNPNIYFMKYEDLINSPEKVLREICNFLGEEFHTELLEVTVVNSFYDEQGKAGFDSSTINRWQKILKPSQVYLIDLLSSKHRRVLGYEDYHEKSRFLEYLLSTLTEICILPIKKISKFFKWVKVN